MDISQSQVNRAVSHGDIPHAINTRHTSCFYISTNMAPKNNNHFRIPLYKTVSLDIHFPHWKRLKGSFHMSVLGTRLLYYIYRVPWPIALL